MSANSPALARAILSLAVSPEQRDAVLGDLEEEFTERKNKALPHARWYWTQVITSIPRLVTHRLKGPEGIQLLFILIAAALAYFTTTLWDLAIARNIAQGAARNFSQAPLFIIRAFYLLAQAMGFAIAGALVAMVLNKNNKPGKQQNVTLLVLLAVLLIAPTLWKMAAGTDPYPLIFRLTWLSVSLPAFFIGAAFILNRRS